MLITVDGQSVADTVQTFSFSRTKVWEFPVGHDERHLVRIEKHRQTFFAGFRAQPVLVYVDGVLVLQRDA